MLCLFLEVFTVEFMMSKIGGDCGQNIHQLLGSKIIDRGKAPMFDTYKNPDYTMMGHQPKQLVFEL